MGLKGTIVVISRDIFLQVGSGIWFTMLPLQVWFCKKPWKNEITKYFQIKG